MASLAALTSHNEAGKSAHPALYSRPMAGFAIIIGFDLLGLLLHAAGIPLPAHVLGMILLAAALFAGWVKLEWVADSAGFLLRHMLLFFVPAIVGVITYASLLRQNWLGLGGGLVISVLASLLVTGLVAERLLRFERK